MQEREAVLADLQLVAVAELERVDAIPVDVGPVERAAVVDPPLGSAANEDRVIAGHGDVIEKDRTVGPAPDRHPVACEEEALPCPSAAGSHDQDRAVVLSGLTATNNVIASGTTNAAFVILNGTDWANLSGSNPVAATYGTDTFSAGVNTDVTLGASPAAFMTNTLRFNTGSPTLTLTGTNLLNAGGILIGSGAGAVTVDGTGTIAGTGATGTNVRELNVFQNSSSVASLNAVIADNRAVNAGQAPATSLNKFGTGTSI